MALASPVRASKSPQRKMSPRLNSVSVSPKRETFMHDQYKMSPKRETLTSSKKSYKMSPKRETQMSPKRETSASTHDKYKSPVAKRNNVLASPYRHIKPGASLFKKSATSLAINMDKPLKSKCKQALKQRKSSETVALTSIKSCVSLSSPPTLQIRKKVKKPEVKIEQDEAPPLTANDQYYIDLDSLQSQIKTGILQTGYPPETT